MKARTLILIVVLGAIAVFAAMNWSAFTAPTVLTLGFTEVQAPLGLVMLGMLVFLSALFLVFLVYLQTSVLLDTRRHTREMQVQRELADQAEASRFTELRTYLEGELQRITERQATSEAALHARLEQLDHDMRFAVEQSGNSLAAYIGELEDRLERGSGSGSGGPRSLTFSPPARGE